MSQRYYYVPALPRIGGAWSARGEMWLEPAYAMEYVEKWRGKGCSDQMFTFTVMDAEQHYLFGAA